MKDYTALGIELGSTRIKAVLTDGKANVLALGSSEWQNDYVDGYWTYSEQDIWRSLQACIASLSHNYMSEYGTPLTRVDFIGISAMMHGYFALNKRGELLVPFRTWRNTNTGTAAAELTQLFDFNIPMRWSVAHFYGLRVTFIINSRAKKSWVSATLPACSPATAKVSERICFQNSMICLRRRE